MNKERTRKRAVNFLKNVTQQLQGSLTEEEIEAELTRAKAGRILADMAEKLRALPDDEKPTPEEINEIVREVRTKTTAKNQRLNDSQE